MKPCFVIVSTLAFFAAPVHAADMAGVWELHADFDDRNIPGVWAGCTFTQDGEHLNGRCEDAALTGHIKAEDVTWSLTPTGTNDALTFTGMVDQDRTVMVGRFTYAGKGGGSFLAVARSVGAQSVPAGEASVTEKEKINTEKARVYVATVQPHRPVIAPNGHATNRLFIYMDDGVMTRREGTRPAITIGFHRGDVGWIPASHNYVSENTTDHTVRILEVDLKNEQSRPAPTTKLDPTVVDPKHYQAVLENDQVRVLRIHFEPHDKGTEHEHILNRVVFNLNDQSSGKADDVRMAGAAVHTEENQADTPADRIAVELK